MISFEHVAGDWLDTKRLDEKRVSQYKEGRIGASFVGMGLFLVLLGTKLIIPKNMDPQKEDNAYKEMVPAAIDPFEVKEEEEEEEDEEFWNPLLWKRTHLVFASGALCATLIWVWEFSYSSTFETYVYQFIVLFKIIQMIMDHVLGDLMKEAFLLAPLMVVIEVSEILITMGASDFIDFTLSFFVELSVMIIERLYLDPGLRTLMASWPKYKLMIRRKFRKRRRMNREQKALEEAEWRRTCEQVCCIQ